MIVTLDEYCPALFHLFCTYSMVTHQWLTFCQFEVVWVALTKGVKEKMLIATTDK